eukprot:INCI18334.2.p1 GENE.INCI18334.2~~INCI18334.2.p1  ORF type:complete len:355 (+),score=72.74 INCI18334.2:333-1397(+)
MPSLGIKRTKYGPGDKKKAYLVDGLTAFYIVLAVLVGSAILIYSVVQTKESLWGVQHELMDEKTEAEKFSHKAAVEILQMTGELEAHLAEEIEWDTQERQYFERVQELEEELRFGMIDKVGKLKDEIRIALDGASVPKMMSDKVLGALEPVIKSLSKDTDGAIGKFGDDMETLGQMYLDYIKTETSRDKDRLAVLHQRVAKFSKEAGLPAVNSLSDDELDAKLYKFLKNADSETEIAYAMELPGPVAQIIKHIKDQFELSDVVEVQQQLHDLLFPQGKKDQESKYGAPAYRGGSIEAYLDRLLFLHKYRTELHPQLHATARKWQNHEISSAEFLQFMLGGVEKGIYPAQWLLGY